MSLMVPLRVWVELRRRQTTGVTEANDPAYTLDLQRLRSLMLAIDSLRQELLSRGPSTDEWREWGRSCTFAHGVYGVYWARLIDDAYRAAADVTRHDERLDKLRDSLQRASTAWRDGAEPEHESSEDVDTKLYDQFLNALADACEAAEDLGLIL